MLNIGLCQMRVVADKEANLRRAEQLVLQAAEQGADVVILPEMFNCPYDNRCFPAYGEVRGGETWQRLSHLAQEAGLTLVGGSIPEQAGEALYNTCFVFGPDGKELGYHRKAHLFDVNIQGGQHFLESETLTPGEKVTLLETPFGTIGVAICFDIRFGELFQVMAQGGAKVIFVPAAFNMTTGPAHWELSFRMRALDNQCFVVGCAPARDAQASYVAYGNSILCDPWGKVVARMGAEEGLCVAAIDLDQIGQYRAEIPITSGRRTDLYETRKKGKE